MNYMQLTIKNLERLIAMAKSLDTRSDLYLNFVSFIANYGLALKNKQDLRKADNTFYEKHNI